MMELPWFYLTTSWGKGRILLTLEELGIACLSDISYAFYPV